jgi:hypothetical protein
MLTLTNAHWVRDRWAHQNRIDPDYLHHLAMKARSHAAVIDAQHE